jgi:hypothetical protein
MTRTNSDGWPAVARPSPQHRLSPPPQLTADIRFRFISVSQKEGRREMRGAFSKQATPHLLRPPPQRFFFDSHPTYLRDCADLRAIDPTDRLGRRHQIQIHLFLKKKGEGWCVVPSQNKQRRIFRGRHPQRFFLIQTRHFEESA